MQRQSEPRAGNHQRHTHTRNASLPTQANHTVRGARKQPPNWDATHAASEDTTHTSNHTACHQGRKRRPARHPPRAQQVPSNKALPSQHTFWVRIAYACPTTASLCNTQCRAMLGSSRSLWVCLLLVLGSALWRAWMCLCWNECVCIEFVPAGVSCLCPYDNMLSIGPVNSTHTHTVPFLCCLLYTSPSPRDRQKSRMPSSA